MAQIVWFFEKPTIGYCPKCETTAIYMMGEGPVCPKCGTTKLSIFEWDGESRHPEDEDDEEEEEDDE